MNRPPKPIDESTYAGRFAARLRELREKAGKSGGEMAVDITKAGYNCSKRTYHDWESGNPQPMNAMPAIAKALKVDVIALFPLK